MERQLNKVDDLVLLPESLGFRCAQIGIEDQEESPAFDSADKYKSYVSRILGYFDIFKDRHIK